MTRVRERAQAAELEDGPRVDGLTVDFEHRIREEDDRAPSWRRIQNEVVPYGEPWFVHHAAQHYRLTLHEPPLDWLPRLPTAFRGRSVQAMTLAEARTMAHRAFIKPADQKAFPAAVYGSGAALPTLAPEFDAHPVLIQEVVRWVSEIRSFGLKGRGQTATVCLRDGKLAQHSDDSFPATDSELRDAVQFCEAAAAAHVALTPDAVVIDVGRIDGRGWAVVEANEPHSSGLYGCDPVEVLRVLRSGCGATRVEL